jgi:prophage antirepressor-like protein
MSSICVLDRRYIFDINITAYGNVGRPYFRVEDVAEWLGISDVAGMLEYVDDDEKVKMILPSELCTGELQPNIEYWFLSEFGFYEILFQSQSPIAQGFRKGAKNLLNNLRTGGRILRTDPDDGFRDSAMSTLRRHMKAVQQSGSG